MIYKIKIKGIAWLIDLKNRVLIREDRPDEIRELNDDELQWFREYIIRMYGYGILNGY